jgi:hypothetical protein
MGNSSNAVSAGYKREEGGKYLLFNINSNLLATSIKRLEKMATVKLVFIVMDWLGIPGSLLYWLANLGTWKSDILFIVLLMYLIPRAIFFIIKQVQEAKLRNIRIRERDFEVDEKIENADHEKDL